MMVADTSKMHVFDGASSRAPVPVAAGVLPARSIGSFAWCAIAGLLAVILAFSLAGCKESDSIVERIYDQSSPHVDYDNPEKIYIPDFEADEVKDDLDLDTDDTTQWDEVVRDLPDVHDDGQQEASVAQGRYAPEARANATAAQAAEGEGATRDDAAGGAGDDQQAVPAGPSGTRGSEEGQGDSPEQGNDQGTYGVDPDDDDYLERTYDSTYGRTENLPTDVATVVATGELATIALSFGSAGVLVGSSADYLAKPAVQEVFSAKGIAQAHAVWAGDGHETTEAEARAIVDAKPDACLVYPGQLSAHQERMIGQNCPDTVIVTLPKPTSVGNIEAEVMAIGRLLSDGTGKASAEKAQAYLDFVDRVVDKAESAHGGGLVTYDSVDYGRSDAGKAVTAESVSAQQIWTLYIDGWDDDAKVTASYQGTELFSDEGVAYTDVGWSWSPLSYYMSVGGVVNNAAAYGLLSNDAKQAVLCLNQNQVSFTWKDFCLDMDESRGGGSFSRYRAFYTLTNARNGAEAGSSGLIALHALGSDDFNTVIVKTSHIKEALERARANGNGLYTQYGYVSTASESAYGRLFTGTKGQSIIYATVKGDSPWEVLVNPCGYVGSWTDGSIEAPLEALWIASRYWGLDEQELEDAIVEFYGSFYDGYTPNLSKILDGSYAE